VNYKQYLDLGAGTGDLAREIRSTTPQATIIAADFNDGIVMGMGRIITKVPAFNGCSADAQALPFSSDIFDGIVS
jgi:ubiquinone/menaquinone biosynthesis C-methylase UbiE